MKVCAIKVKVKEAIDTRHHEDVIVFPSGRGAFFIDAKYTWKFLGRWARSRRGVGEVRVDLKEKFNHPVLSRNIPA